jgi:hypothetical protein
MTQLACEGGRPVRSDPFPFWPNFEADEMESAMLSLKTGRVNYWTGQEGREFEKEYAAFVGMKYAVALMNGSVALEAALLALGMAPGDEVITTSRTFIASASCVCDMDPILALAKEKGLWVVEDCAQAHGAAYKGRPVGSMGDVAAFSFCQDKIITTGGEGGMLTTSSRDVREKVWSYKDHGKSYDAFYHRKSQPGFRWLHESFGTNWRMTEFQAAIGRVQLRKLPQWTALRRRNAAILIEGFSGISGLRVTIPPPEICHAWYKCYVFVQPEALKIDWSRDRIMSAVCAEGIPCGSGSCSEIYLEKAFDGHPSRPAVRLPVARRLGETSLM